MVFREDTNPIPLNDDFAITQQLRGLNQRLNELQDQLDGLGTASQAIARNISTGVITNFLRNSDVNTSDAGRRLFTYTSPNNASDVVAFFYGPDSSSTGPFTDSSTGTESPEAIPAADYSLGEGTINATSKNLSVTTPFFTAGMATMRCIVVGAGVAGANLDTIIDTFTDSTHVILHDAADTSVTTANVIVVAAGQGCAWASGLGTLWWGGSQTIVSPLQKNYSRPGVGNNIFILFNIRLNPILGGVALTDDYQIRASIWDNTASQQTIITGAAIDITATLVRGSGAVKRQYVIRYLNASGDSFLSNVSSPASVSGTPDPTAIDPGQVSVVFTVYDGVQSVQLFRSDDTGSLSDYYLLATSSTGINELQDVGGRSGQVYNFTDDPWLADALIIKVGTKLTSSFLPASLHILTPATYDLSLTDPNSQWLRLDVLDVDGNIVTIDPMALELDFFGLSYRPGTWVLSADDQQAEGDFESSTPDPTGGLPTGPPDDPGGGGTIGKGGGFFEL